MIKEMYLNIPVKDLNKTIAFFKKVGFKFNKQFTNEKAACMLVGPNIYAMLLTEKFFKTFNDKKIINAKKEIEAIIGLAVGSRKEVDTMVKKALASGGKEPRKGYDHGWMYGRTFQDLDGHSWEIFWMDPKKMPKSI